MAESVVSATSFVHWYGRQFFSSTPSRPMKHIWILNNHKISFSFNTPCQALGPFGVFSLNQSRGGQRRPPNKNGLELGPEKWIASQEGDHGRIFQAKRRLGTKVWAWRRVCCIWGTKSCPDAWTPKESEVASTDGQAGRGWGREDLVGVHKEEGAPSHRLSTPP